jgi:asparaginyl-tRNA synthetase
MTQGVERLSDSAKTENTGREIFEPPELDGTHFRARRIPELLKIRATAMQAIRQTLESEGYLEVQTPILTSLTGACEDLSTLFDVEYFDKRAFLRQTSQLYLESFIYSEDTPKVFTVGSSFRAEPKVDKRRLTEFNLVEVEFAGANLDSIISLISLCIREAVGRVVRDCRKELEALGRDVSELDVFGTIARKTYAEAIAFLQSEGVDVALGDDLGHRFESILTEHFGPLFVTHYPKAIKFFNMKENENDPTLVNCADLLLPVSGESVGASEREESWQKLYDNLHSPEMEQAFERVGGNCLDFKWYLDLRRPQPISHGGFGIGFERLMQFILGTDSVQEVAPYPRDAASLSP